MDILSAFLGHRLPPANVDRSQTALILPESNVKITYSQLRQNSTKLGHLLRKTIILAHADKPELSPVAMIMRNGAAFVSTFLALAAAGYSVAPLNPNYTASEFELFLNSLSATVVVIEAGDHSVMQSVMLLAERMEIQVFEYEAMGGKLIKDGIEIEDDTKDVFEQPRPERIALLLQTSGTTSKPKLVPLTHRNIDYATSQLSKCYELTSTDACMLVMPLFHVHGLIGCLLTTLKSGGTIILPEKFHASSFTKHLCEYKATWYSAVPTIHKILLRDPKYLAINGNPIELKDHTLRFVRSCSSALDISTYADLTSRFRVPVYQAYGMTETCHLACSTNKDNESAVSVGLPIGVSVKIIRLTDASVCKIGEQGEICLSGPNVIRGYLSPAAANTTSFTSDMYFRTGDLGHFDQSGQIHVNGRIKEIINRGGEKINPIDIDRVLLQHPNVSAAICFGIEDNIYGETVAAAIVLKAEIDNQAAFEDEIGNFCRNHMATFKCPSKYFVVDDLPKTVSGKVQRLQLAKHFTQPQ